MWIIEVGSEDGVYVEIMANGWERTRDKDRAHRFNTREEAAEYASRFIPRESYVAIRKV